MQNNYSCVNCLNRGCERKCKRCFHEADKKPTKFKLDKSSQPCPALSNDGSECSTVTEIRELKSKIAEIDEKIRLIDQCTPVDAKPIIDFIDATHRLNEMRLYSVEDHMMVEYIVSSAFGYVSCAALIASLEEVRNKENRKIHLRRERNELQEKVNTAMKKLGI